MDYKTYVKTTKEGFKKILLDKFETMRLNPIISLEIDSVSRDDDFKDYHIYYTIVAYNRYGQEMKSSHIYHINEDRFDYINNSLEEV